ncbi:unnamed protein product [Cladocopium goreaui]|uniref:Uncharacterized protein n=1 Tax=Cladocopium goreaui TaxID=2562237 RepID=A0A9P1BWM5_9DINO|nr:unnamed protein product [Cladocopium goreaui]
MDELQPNPDDCPKFEPNAFKQEKCKHCSRPWTEHKDVISEEFLQKFLKKRQQAQEDKEKKEAEAEQAAAAKKQAKKRASQAAEDDWLFDDKDKKDAPQASQADDNDSEDDFTFRMFAPDELEKLQCPPPPVNKELKVVNLIDWDECDVADETEEVTGGEATGSSVSTRAPLIEAASYPTMRGDLGFQDTGQLSAGGMPYQSGNQDLQTEIQLLRQMLADANEEKTIQVAIVRDEVAEKQEQVQELTRQKSELEALLREARSKLDSCGEKEKEVERDHAEEERLKARMAELEAKLQEKEVERDHAEEERLKARMAELEAKLQEERLKARMAELEAKLQEERLKARMAELEAKLQEKEVERDHAEEERLKARMAELEAKLQEKEVERDHAEEERLKAQMAELEAKLQAAQAEKAAEMEKVAEVQRAAEAQIAAAAGGAEAAVSSQIQEALVTVSEVTELCNRTSRILCEECEGAESSSSSHLQAELARCRERAQSAANAAERVISDKRQLVAKVEELERLERERKDYAQAVRDVRLYAEQQLALILQRMSVSHGHQAELPKLGS